jgi:hypothetical protein
MIGLICKDISSVKENTMSEERRESLCLISQLRAQVSRQQEEIANLRAELIRMLSKKEKGTVFTTGKVAKICKVSPRTVSKWFDTDRLKGYRIPGSLDRRIPRKHLIQFMKENGIPLDDFEEATTDKT